MAPRNLDGDSVHTAPLGRIGLSCGPVRDLKSSDEKHPH